jgi:hypothetical protein
LAELPLTGLRRAQNKTSRLKTAARSRRRESCQLQETEIPNGRFAPRLHSAECVAWSSARRGASARWSWGRSEIQERRNGKDLNHSRIVKKYSSTFARRRILKSKNWLKCAGCCLAGGLPHRDVARSLSSATARGGVSFSSRHRGSLSRCVACQKLLWRSLGRLISISGP